MTPYRPVIRLSELVEDEGRVVTLDDEEIALFLRQGEVFAIENRCPHQGASLAEGWLEGESISCPWHAWCFELRTGRMTLGDFGSIAVYPVRIEDGMVCLGPPKREGES